MADRTRTCYLCYEPVDKAPILYEGSEPYHVRCRWPGYGQCDICMGIITRCRYLVWMRNDGDTYRRYHKRCWDRSLH